MTEQEKIEQAAKDHARQWHKDNPDEYKNPDASPRVDFLAGASFYAKEVMPGMIAGFIDWGNGRGLYRDKQGVWHEQQGYGSSVFAIDDAELVNLFLEQSKQKDNEQQT